MEENVETRTLADLNPAPPVCVPPTARVGEVVRLLAEKNIGCVLVVWCDALVGIFSERDALMKIGTRFDELADNPIRHFMTPAPETLSPDDTIAFGLNRMAVGDFRHIPIEEDEHPVGIVSIRDLLRYVTEQFPECLATAD
jgi:CBS domain-containing protein